MSLNTISPDRLLRLIGTPKCPNLVDLRDPHSPPARLVPGSVPRALANIDKWAAELEGPSIMLCSDGRAASEGAAAYLRAKGLEAETLEGGTDHWLGNGFPSVDPARIPARNRQNRTVWVTRARPKIDRIACPWLIRRFVDPTAVFLFVTPSEVPAVAERFEATPFDCEGIFWSHRGELCTFDVMLDEFGLDIEPLRHLARIVRGADTARLDFEPEVPGLLAASLGLSRMYADDLAQLEAGLGLYDAFYRWCRDATGETHNWPTSKGTQK